MGVPPSGGFFMTPEQSFQAYFLRTVPHGYRTSLVAGGGFPDVLLIHGELHSLVELKIMKGKNRLIKNLFKPTQPPWYVNYLSKGGKRLFVLFKKGSKYALLRIDNALMKEFFTLKYSDLPRFIYREYSTLIGLIHEEFPDVT